MHPDRESRGELPQALRRLGALPVEYRKLKTLFKCIINNNGRHHRCADPGILGPHPQGSIRVRNVSNSDNF